MKVFVVCSSLVEVRGNTIPDNVNEVMVCHFGIDIESIDIMQVF